MNDLKPCPFCGNETIEIATFNQATWFYECIECLATGGVSTSKLIALKAWNTRHHDDAPTYIRKLQILQAQLDKATALYGCACERMEMLERARDGWAEKYKKAKRQLQFYRKIALRYAKKNYNSGLVELIEKEIENANG